MHSSLYQHPTLDIYKFNIFKGIQYLSTSFLDSAALKIAQKPWLALRIHLPQVAVIQPWTQVHLNHGPWTEYNLHPVLKGQYCEINILFEDLSIVISNFSAWAVGVQGLSKAFHCPIQL